jgi:hypothetical protein
MEGKRVDGDLLRDGRLGWYLEVLELERVGKGFGIWTDGWMDISVASVYEVRASISLSETLCKNDRGRIPEWRQQTTWKSVYLSRKL